MSHLQVIERRSPREIAEEYLEWKLLTKETAEKTKQLREELLAASEQIKLMRKEVATLRVGSAIDEKANAEIRDTVELQQKSIADLKEEISFYKGVMAPGSDQKGLRVESFDVSIPDASNKVEYSLLLTQVVENHELVQGKVEVSVSGMMGRTEEILALNKLDDDKAHPVSFRFRYFQNIKKNY